MKSDTDTAIENLSKTMSELITIVKGQQEKGSSRKNRNNNNSRNGSNDRKGVNGNKDGRNQKGPDPNASGPFRNGASPIQCYKYWGWGHKSSVCLSHLNYQGVQGSKTGTNIPSPPQLTCEQRADQHKPRNNPKAKPTVRTIHDRCHNPDPIVRLIGMRSESKVIVDGKEYPGLLDAGAQMSTITFSQARKTKLKIESLDKLLDIEGGGGVSIPSIGYVEVSLKIPEIPAYDKDALMMVMNDSRHGDMVPFDIGTKHIHAALEVITEKYWAKLGQPWRSVALPASAAKFSEMEHFNLDSLQGDVKVHKTTILPPLSTTFFNGRSKVKGHHKIANVAPEHSNNVTNSNIAAVRSYSFMKPGSNKVVVSFKNLTSKDINLKAGTVVGKVKAANGVPPMLAKKLENVNVTSNTFPNTTSDTTIGSETETKDSKTPEKHILTQDEVDLLMSKLDLEGIKSWSPEEQNEVKDLIIEYGSLFALKDMDLGKTDKVKHNIKLTDALWPY